MRYCELLKPNQTIIAERYQQQLIDLNRALNQECPIIVQRKRKVISLHDNARPHAKIMLKTHYRHFNGKSYHMPHAFSSDCVSSD